MSARQDDKHNQAINDGEGGVEQRGPDGTVFFARVSSRNAHKEEERRDWL